MTVQFFQDLPLQFFRPLVGGFAPLYGVVLARLYELDFEGEPFEITQDVAIEQAALLIEQQAEFLADSAHFRERLQEEWSSPGTIDASAESGEQTEEREARRLARYLLKRLETCGWFDYEYRESRKGYVLNFRDYAARILHTLVQVAKREQPSFEGLAQSIKAALGPQELAENPGVALYNAQESTRTLVREIKILSRNIRRYIDRALKEAKTSKELLELQLDIYQKKVIDSSYHRFKTTDNIFRYRSFILKQLNAYEEGTDTFTRAREWTLKNSDVDSTVGVMDWVQMIRNQLGSIHLFTEDLDRKNARYTATTLQRIGYLLNQDHLIENKLYALLENYGKKAHQFTYLPTPHFAAFKIRFWDQYSLYRKPKAKAEMAVQSLELDAVSEDTKRRVLAKTKQSIDGQFSKRRVHELARQMLLNRPKGLPVSEAPFETMDDFIRFVFISYHGIEKKAPYAVELVENWKEKFIQKNRFELRDGKLFWKGK